MDRDEVLEILQSDVIDDPEDLLMWLGGDGIEVLKEHAALEAEVERMRGALEAVEWSRRSPYVYAVGVCPWCDNMERYGHAPSCKRQAALETQP